MGAFVFRQASSDFSVTNSAMTIDSSGNVGIGGSPQRKLYVMDSANGYNLGLQQTSAYNSGNQSGIVFSAPYNSGGSVTDLASIRGGKENTTDGNYGGNLRFYTRANGGSDTERMRIDSSGHLLVGKTAAAVATQGIEIRSNGEFFSTIGNALTTLHVYSTAGAYRFYVTGAGQIHATSTSISSLSDERLKENIVDLETGLSEVMALQPRRFDWKNGDKTNVAGFIAQEVETVLPDLIDGFKDESIEEAKGVRMGDMLPTLVKAIQEQQTLIESLTARITTLEG